MSRSIGMTITITVVLLALAGLSALQEARVGRPAGSSNLPDHSSYHAGPTGSRAFYQLLEESGRPVARWRESWEELEKGAGGAILVVIGPLDASQSPSDDETIALARWIDNGGQLIVISANSLVQLPGVQLTASPLNPGGSHSGSASPANAQRNSSPGSVGSERLFTQPTRLTRAVNRLVLSPQAGRITRTPVTPPGPATDEPRLSGEIVHFEDENGAILVDFEFGSGRVLFLTDPFFQTRGLPPETILNWPSIWLMN